MQCVTWCFWSLWLPAEVWVTGTQVVNAGYILEVCLPAVRWREESGVAVLFVDRFVTLCFWLSIPAVLKSVCV